MLDLNVTSFLILLAAIWVIQYRLVLMKIFLLSRMYSLFSKSPIAGYSFLVADTGFWNSVFSYQSLNAKFATGRILILIFLTFKPGYADY